MSRAGRRRPDELLDRSRPVPHGRGGSIRSDPGREPRPDRSREGERLFLLAVHRAGRPGQDDGKGGMSARRSRAVLVLAVIASACTAEVPQEEETRIPRGGTLRVALFDENFSPFDEATFLDP